MFSNVRTTIRRLYERLTPKGEISYAQCGEDLIIDFALRQLGIAMPRYLDIGAHHPTLMSNTYRFYRRGCRGVLVEPDPTSYAQLARARPGDVCLNVGAGYAIGPLPFYIMSAPWLSTFSAETKEQYLASGTVRLVAVREIPVMPAGSIIAQHLSGGVDLVSIDTEGGELPILQSIDFTRARPAVFCIETLSYSTDRRERKLTECADYLRSHDYMIYADTYINTIFVDGRAWQGR